MILLVQFITWFTGAAVLFSVFFFGSLDLLNKAKAKVKAKLKSNEKFMKWLEG